jgi:hypothetical protein
MSDRIEPTTIYSDTPYIAQYDNWLLDADIATILNKDFKFVTGRVRKPDGSLKVDKARKCETRRIEYGEDSYFDSLTQRVADFFSVPNLMYVEPFPMMKYNPGDYFNWHSDLTDGFTTQRTATMIMYLNDDFEGGATCFQHLGLKIQPKRGSVLVYYYTPASPLVHRGAAVISGTKFILTAFVRNGEFTLENRKSVSY